jgi:hypothetical protein
MGGKPIPEGDWPYVDLVFLKDYEDPAGRKRTKSAVRIHLDIPIDENHLKEIDKAVYDGNLAGAYQILLENSTMQSDPSAQALAVVQAAFGMILAKR